MKSWETRPITGENLETIAAKRYQNSLRNACLIAKTVDEFRGQSTLVLDLTAITPICDFFVITAGTSRRQMHAIAEEVDRVMEDSGSKRQGIEGYAESTWILQDYGDVVLHIFTPEARNIYDLEGLWADAKRIDWENADSTA